MVTAVIVETGVAESAVPAKLKSIDRILDDVPALDTVLRQLTRWVADYYVCSWGEVLKAALPNGISQVSKQTFYRNEAADVLGLGAIPQALLDYIHQNPGVSKTQLAKKYEAALGKNGLRKLEAAGLIRSEVEVEGAKVRVKTEKHLRILKPDFDLIFQQLKGEKQRAIWQALRDSLSAGAPEPTQSQILNAVKATGASLKALIESGAVEVVEKEVIRSPYGDEPDTGSSHKETGHRLHRAQIEALEAVSQAIENEVFKGFLLHGVTGSGKTEVYIEALKKTIAKGKTGIILVPEIALTPQTVRRFRAHFGDKVAVLHSRMSDGERYDAWRLLRDGRYQIVIGPRSAIFAPLENVGLIVVDEEHESSYKQFDPAPRYHARDVALVRASIHKAVCVLGSATPSLESYVNAERGKLSLLRMPQRVPVAGKPTAPMPKVWAIDLGIEQQKRTLEGVISQPLRLAIQKRLAAKEQVILLQNRRGYAPVVACTDCGWSPHCPHCAVTLTFHKTQHKLRCHYCGHVQPMPPNCNLCEGALKQVGVGTQRVEEELKTLFPEVRLLRMDQDTTARKYAHQNILNAFGTGEADVLLGTQMVAKGLDFPNVTLVGVINADTGLLLPDFRSGEQTFQLLAQVAGRAGRGDKRGEVLLQTRSMRHAAIQFAETHNYLGFIESEMPIRKALGYPPFGRMVAIEFKSPDFETVQAYAERWTEGLKQALAPIREQMGSHVLEVLGPVEPMVARIKMAYRLHTLIRAGRQVQPIQLQTALRHLVQTFPKPPLKVHYAIDVDPQGLF